MTNIKYLWNIRATLMLSGCDDNDSGYNRIRPQRFECIR